MVTSGTVDYINSWNTNLIEVNGLEFTNKYSSNMPARENGKYYFKYESTNSSGHIEIKGTGEGSAVTYQLTTTVVGQGSISPSGGTFNVNETISLTASPAQGWEFSHWEQNTNNTNATISLVMDADKNITAMFTEIVNTDEFNLTVTTTGNGSVSANPSGGVYLEGTLVELSATASTGSHFVNWTGDVSGTSSSILVTINSDKNVVANFEPDAVNPCDLPQPISLTFKFDGSGEYCWETSDDISYINSWNLVSLTINGTDFTNLWSNSFPSKINGKYYISYSSEKAWGHFEAAGSNKNGSINNSSVKPNMEKTMVAYPNPVDNLLTLEFDNESYTQLEMTDITEKSVYSSQLKTNQSKHHINMDIYNKGIYFIKLSNDYTLKTLRIIKK